MASIVLRSADQDDVPAIARVHIRSWREAYTGIVPQEILTALSVDSHAAMWSDILANPHRSDCEAVVLAQQDGRTVGFGACGRQRDKALAEAGYGGEIGALYVLRSHYRQGVGRSLVRLLARELTTAGHASAALWVLRDNAIGRSFYHALNGAVVSERSVPFAEVAYGWTDLMPLSRLL